MVTSTPSPSARDAGPATPPAVSLPKGGGAIRGIGEKFGANPVTGTGSITVPVAVSAGRSGFEPALTLAYDSGSGNGIFGVGWSLSLPAITRRTDRGVPRYALDRPDTFLLSGAEDLVEYRGRAAGGWQPERESRQEAGHAYTVRRYRPRIEGLFARIEQWTDIATGDVHWRSVTRDNVTSIYGRDETSRLADPADTGRIFSWLICESYDDRGNAMEYAYKAEDGVGVDLTAPHESNRPPSNRTVQRHPKAVRYGNRVPRPTGAATPAMDWMFEVVFDYGEHDLSQPTPTEQTPWTVREDAFSTYRAGFELRTYRRCRRILMFHHFPSEPGVGQDCLVRATELAHRPDPVGSKLASVTHVGFRRRPDGSYVRGEIPPVEFDYTTVAVDDQVRELASDAASTLLPAGVDGDRYRFLDLDGEGLPGVLAVLPGAWYFTPNLGEGRFGPTSTVPATPRTSAAPLFLDLAGDGQLDVVDLDGPLPGFFERTPDRGWAPLRTFPSHPVVDLDAPHHYQVDLTGDGHADLLTAQADVVEWYPSLAEDGFAAAMQIAGASGDGSAPFADAPPAIATYFADMSGDGLPDFVHISNGEIAYWPSLGHGHFGAKVTMDAAPMFDEPDQFDPARLRIADVDGSGTTDVVYLHRHGARIFANRSGNGWGPAQALGAGFPDANSTAGIEVVDLLGNGTACLVWSSPLPRDRATPLRYIDLMGGQKPHLLVGVRNNLGAETVIRYAPSTRFYLDDQAAGRPWVTRLPFPVHVVERVETRDLITRNVLTTRYAYHHGFYDGAEREFRGFAMVEQWDSEVLDAIAPAGASNLDTAHSVPPALTRTWFHTGAPGDAEVTRALAGEYYDDDITVTGTPALALLEDTVLPTSVRSGGLVTPLRLTADEEREARRALKGSMLRREVYGRDGSQSEARPYVLAEHNYTVEMLQPAVDGEHAVFFVHPRETLTAHHERAVYSVGGTDLHDPRVVHDLVLEVDEFGNVTRSASIAYGRRHDDPDPLLSAADHAAQATTHVVVTESSYTNAVSTVDAYRVPLLSETSIWEITGLAPDTRAPEATNLFGFDELAGKLGAVATELPYREWRVDPATLTTPVRRLVERIRTLYRQDDLAAALPLGSVQSRALPFEEYRLALPDVLVTGLYGADAGPADLTEAGYVHEDGGWWAPSWRIHYSPAHVSPAEELAQATAHFFLPRRLVDPFGASTVVDYDDGNDLLVTATRDARDNETQAVNDYRLLQPAAVVDPNGNRTEVAFDALGLVVATAIMGKPGQDPGDRVDGIVPDLDGTARPRFFADPEATAPGLLSTATTRLVHDLFAFMRSSAAGAPPEPPWTATLARETHVADLAAGQESRIQLAFAYSDGFGREIQRKAKAEPGPAGETRWGGTGWTIVNNKGKPVRTYEPFFSGTHRCELDLTVGVSTVTFYDPLDRVVATIRPDGTWEKQVIGTWRQSAWDANDTVRDDPGPDADIGGVIAGYLAAHGPWSGWRDRRSGAVAGSAEAEGVAKADAHARTPSSSFMDSLGRPFLAIEHNRVAGVDSFFATRTLLDIEGNQREVVDARGRLVMRYDVDMLATVVRRASMEAGERRELHDVGGQVLIGWGSRGFRRHIDYDELRRPVRVSVRGVGLPGEIVEQEIEYGDDQPADDRNLRTRVREQRDAAGVLTNVGFDRQGNLLGARRELAVEYAVALDWSGPVPLTGESFASESEFDALNRPTRMEAPDGTQITPTYNDAGLLETVATTLPDGRTVAVITNVDYDAQGRRTRCDYGNGTTTTYTYDPLTFRLDALRTTRGPERLQDLFYTYDPVGNITRITDPAQQTIFFRNRRVDPDCDYTYDAVYRLIEATGREHLGQLGAPTPPGATDAPRVGLLHPGDGNAMGRYTQRYAYDEVGNLLTMAHVGADPDHPGWTLPYTYLESSQLDPTQVSNRLTSTTPGTALTYDEHGNTTSMPELSGMTWNHLDRLSSTARQQVNNGMPETTYYVYDVTGERVRKVTERERATGNRGSRKSDHIYLAGFEIHRTFDTPDAVHLERLTTHVVDGTSRVAMIERRTTGTDGSPPTLVRFQQGNHLGSASLELDDQAQIISYEEHYPYGPTSYQAVRNQTESPKRYRYTGKERDEETGLNYHGARYYAPWLACWISCDPVLPGDGTNAYLYAHANPVMSIDLDGLESRHVELGGGVTAFLEFRWGSQDSSSAVGANVFGALTSEIGTLEAGLSYTISHNYERFDIGDLGVAENARGSALNWNVDMSIGPNQTLTGMNSGSPVPLFDSAPLSEGLGDWSFGVGIGQQIGRLPRRLREFENTQGLLRAAVAVGDYRGSISFINDVRMYGLPLFVLGGGTDLGPTASVDVALSKRTQQDVWTFGSRLDIFTPVPEDHDTGFVPLDRLAEHRPAREIPFPGAKNGIYQTVGDFPDLYHANTFGYLRYQSKFTTLELKVGGDIPAIGRWAQGYVHDEITGSPKFGWLGTSNGLYSELLGRGYLGLRVPSKN